MRIKKTRRIRKPDAPEQTGHTGQTAHGITPGIRSKTMERGRSGEREMAAKFSPDWLSLTGGVLAILFAVFLTAAVSESGPDTRNSTGENHSDSDASARVFSMPGLASGISWPDTGQTLLDFPGLDSDNVFQNFQDFSVSAFASGEVVPDIALPAFAPDTDMLLSGSDELFALPESVLADSMLTEELAFAAGDALPRYAESAPDTPEYQTGQPEQPVLDATGKTYIPSVFSETFLFNGDAIPVYTNLTPRRVEREDFVWNNGRPEYTGDDFIVKFGVDVSEHQNSDRAYLGWNIDWEAARADGVEFAMIRVGFRGTTSGEINEDTCYDRNITGAMNAGIQTGVYFFSQAITIEEALEEADFVLDCLRGYAIDGPVGYDWEIAGRSYRNHGLDKETATACALAFCQRIASGGYTPMVYATRETYYYDFDLGVLAPYLIWYPQYPRGGASSWYPNFYYQMDVWQFSDRCKVEGIGRRVDANLWFLPK